MRDEEAGGGLEKKGEAEFQMYFQEELCSSQKPAVESVSKCGIKGDTKVSGRSDWGAGGRSGLVGKLRA